MVLVPFGDGEGIFSPLLPAENIRASSLADRPPGSDWTFSFCASMISKSTNSSEAAMLATSTDDMRSHRSQVLS